VGKKLEDYHDTKPKGIWVTLPSTLVARLRLQPVSGLCTAISIEPRACVALSPGIGRRARIKPDLQRNTPRTKS
jgi:hypothetical protein